jgi:CDP-glucose 4,6-dehydratase
VLEPLSGYLALAARLSGSTEAALCGGWNFGPAVDGNACVRELVEAFLAAWGGGRWEDKSDPAQPHETTMLRLSIEKAVMQLNWRPAWSFRETIGRTAQWYREYHESRGGDMHKACLRDICEYVEASRPADTEPGSQPARAA